MLILIHLAIYLTSQALIGVSLLLIVAAAFRPQFAVFALATLTLIRQLNPVAFTFTESFGLMGWLLLIVCAIRYLPTTTHHSLKTITALSIFGIITTILTVCTSSAVGVSMMKLISFYVGSVTMFSIIGQMHRKQLAISVNFIFAIILFYVALSCIALLQPHIGYAFNGFAFQGIMNHPQAFGVFLTPICAYIISSIIFSKPKYPIIYYISGPILLVFMVLSQTRTSIAALFLSLFFAAVVFFVKRQESIRWGSYLRVIVSTTLIGIGSLVTLINSPTLQDQLSAFVLKRESSNLEQALESRSGGLESQWANFLEKPLIGFGFGVYPGEVYSKGVRKFMGIPISAPVEKGFLPTAILEEVGIIGTLFFVYLIYNLTFPVIRSKNINICCLYFACLFINIGESVFFSLGGLGLYFMLLIAMSTRATQLLKPTRRLIGT